MAVELREKWQQPFFDVPSSYGLCIVTIRDYEERKLVELLVYLLLLKVVESKGDATKFFTKIAFHR